MAFLLILGGALLLIFSVALLLVLSVAFLLRNILALLLWYRLCSGHLVKKLDLKEEPISTKNKNESKFT